jgi:hypothetical protein
MPLVSIACFWIALRTADVILVPRLRLVSQIAHALMTQIKVAIWFRSISYQRSYQSEHLFLMLTAFFGRILAV